MRAAKVRAVRLYEASPVMTLWIAGGSIFITASAALEALLPI
jgi:hypothetical protein